MAAKQEQHLQAAVTHNNENVEISVMSCTEEETKDLSLEYTVLNKLPDEIIEFILTHLPPYGDLENCALVCKRWNYIVNNLIRRSKINLANGLLDFRLCWKTFQPDYAIETPKKHSLINATNSQASPMLTIAGRFAHSAVRYENFMYVFGGGSSSDTTFNDLWRFDLTRMCWDRPLSMGTYPSPKGSASMVTWREQLVLFGGWRYPLCLFDELHYYDLRENRWLSRVALSGPPAMAGHSASVHGDRMVVFGGYQIKEDVNVNSNETWVLDLYEQRWWQPRFVGNTRPSSRYGQIQVVIDEKHLLIVGGCGGANRLYSDAWLLDMSRDVWVWRTIPIRNKKYGALHMWCNPACKINSYLVVLGPTPNTPQDFQMMKHNRVPVGGGAGNAGPAVNARLGVLGQPPPPPPAGVPMRQLHERINGGIVQRAQANQPNVRLDNQQNRIPAGMANGRGINGLDLQYLANRRAILDRNRQMASSFEHNNNVNNNNNNNNNSNNSMQQPRMGRLSDLQQQRANISTANGAAPVQVAVAVEAENNDNRPSSSSARPPNSNDAAEAAHRLQRNLALRCRDNEPLLPKRFDEVYEDPFRMAAFNVPNRSRSSSRDHNERIRRMEEKMNAIRNSRRNSASGGIGAAAQDVIAAPLPPAQLQQQLQQQQLLQQQLQKEATIREPSPKRLRRNVQSLFVCDLSQVLHSNDPYLEWLEYKNYGVVAGAPDRLILSSLIAGNGELILFGGVHKETLSGITHHVSNSVHFLSAPREIV